MPYRRQSGRSHDYLYTGARAERRNRAARVPIYTHTDTHIREDKSRGSGRHILPKDAGAGFGVWIILMQEHHIDGPLSLVRPCAPVVMFLAFDVLF